MTFRGCTSFFTWLYSAWDFRVGWDGPYWMVREHGTRILGMEFVRFYKVNADGQILDCPEWKVKP